MGSTIKAGGNVNIQATSGDATVRGSQVQAAKNLTLGASRNVNIVASADQETNRSTQKSSSTSVGASFGVGAGGAGASVDVAASRGKGLANSDSTTTTNSLVRAGQRVSISSGADTNVLGGQVEGEQVKVQVGGNLNLQSLQDRASSQAKQSTTGASFSVPVSGAGGSASLSQAKQSSQSNYQSVNEQSGIRAGAGGFQINVQGNTDLQGAVIASTASAEINTLNTQTLSTSDLNNSMSASASSSGTSAGTNLLGGKYELGKALLSNAQNNNGQAGQSDASTATSAISAAQVTVGGKLTDTSQEQLIDSNGKTVSNDTSHSNRVLAKADTAALQQQAQQNQADNMLAVKASTAFTDEAYRAMYKAGAQLYKVPPGCSDKSCAEPLSEEEAKALKASQDGKVHISNNGIFNDLDDAAKYSQRHGGTMNADGSKDYSTKPENQYIIFAPQANNALSDLIIAGVQKSGATPYVGLTNTEQKTAEVIEQATRQGQSLVIDSHSRGSLTTTNAEQSLVNQGGIQDASGNVLRPNIQMNNYGGAQNNRTGNETLRQLTGDSNAQINSVIHPRDMVGESSVIGSNPATPTYTSTAADGTKTETKALSDGRNAISNFINILMGTATPHNCYGTSGNTAGCDEQWDNIPISTATPITNENYKPPVVIPQGTLVDNGLPQVQLDSNAQINQLLRPQPVAPATAPAKPKAESQGKLEILQEFKSKE